MTIESRTDDDRDPVVEFFAPHRIAISLDNVLEAVPYNSETWSGRFLTVTEYPSRDAAQEMIDAILGWLGRIELERMGFPLSPKKSKKS